MEFSIDEPQYFDYYKQFLVEELVAYPNTLKAHYGKCCVYGKLIFYADTQEFILEPVLLINSRRSKQNKNLKIYLTGVPICQSSPVLNYYYEIRGEFYLKSKNQSAAKVYLGLLSTTYDVYLKLNNCSGDKNRLLHEFNVALEPIILIHSIHAVNNPREKIISFMMMRVLRSNLHFNSPE